MTPLIIFRHDLFQEHKSLDSHPESPKRLAAIDRAIAESDLQSRVNFLLPRVATIDEISRVHSGRYLEKLENAALKLGETGGVIQLDSDTFMNNVTFQAAKLAVGAGLAAVDSIIEKNSLGSFVAVRPPGHHARKETQMGFCIFNNIALAARYAREKLNFKRVLIIDWDVHHGNGTEEIFYDDPSVCVISLHQFPFWPPGSGWFTDDGAKDGQGYNINIPLPVQTGDRGYLMAWERLVLPIGLAFQPELILLSAGYDAHQLDPLGGQQISTGGFALLSKKLLELSQLTGAKVISFLEGGYDEAALAESVLATLRVLTAESPERSAQVQDSYGLTATKLGLKSISEDGAPDQVDERISLVAKHFEQYWQCLK